MASDNNNDSVDRRKFLGRAATAGGLAGIAALAGCSSKGSNGNSSGNGGGGNGSSGGSGSGSSSGDLGDKLPKYTYLNNPQSYSPTRHDAINLIAKQMQKAGFDVKVKTMEWGSLYSAVTQEHKYDFATWWTGFNVDPGVFITRHFLSSNTGAGDGNYAGYKNSDLDPKIKQQVQISDDKKRANVMHEIQKTLMTDVPTMPITQMPDLVAYNKDQTSNWKHQRGFGYSSLWTMTNVKVDNSKKQLVGAWPEAIKSLNVMSTTANKVTYQTVLIYDKLVQFDGDFNPSKELSLATDWKRLDDKTVQYTIREGHKWHDGETVTADDVAFSFNYVVENEVPVFSLQTQYIDKAEATDSKTVKLHLKEKVGPVHTLISNQIPIIPKHKWKGRSNPSQASVQKPVGSGPMMYDYWDQGSELGLKKYSDHFAGVNINERIWRIIPQKSTQWDLLKKGKIHYLPFGGISRELNQNKDSKSVGIAQDVSTSFWHITQNNRSKGLDQKVVRQAVVNTVPRSGIAKQLLYGFPKPGSNLVSKAFGDLHTDNVPNYKEGADAAKKRLKDAGFGWDSDGKVHFPKSQ